MSRQAVVTVLFDAKVPFVGLLFGIDMNDHDGKRKKNGTRQGGSTIALTPTCAGINESCT